jgi:FkbM family methyltransferase
MFQIKDKAIDLARKILPVQVKSPLRYARYVLTGDFEAVLLASRTERPSNPWTEIFQKIELNSSAPIYFIDVGANAGQTLELLEQACTDLKISNVRACALEPFTESHGKLQNTIKELKLVKACSLKIALSDGDREIEVSIAPNSQWNSIQNSSEWKKQGLGSEFIRCKAYDNITELDPQRDEILILKIDTEGHELEVLKGAENALSNQIPFAVIIEAGFNPEDLQHGYFPELYDHLLGKGYRVVFLSEITSYRHSDWADSLSLAYCNAVFVRGAKPLATRRVAN